MTLEVPRKLKKSIKKLARSAKTSMNKVAIDGLRHMAAQR